MVSAGVICLIALCIFYYCLLTPEPKKKQRSKQVSNISCFLYTNFFREEYYFKDTTHKKQTLHKVDMQGCNKYDKKLNGKMLFLSLWSFCGNPPIQNRPIYLLWQRYGMPIRRSSRGLR